MSNGNQSQNSHRPRWRIWLLRVLVTVAFIAVGFYAGWQVEYNASWSGNPTSVGRRLAGYDLVSPLLTCSVANNKNFSGSRIMTSKINAQIATEVSSGNISSAAVYFQDLNRGIWADVNDSEQFYPASLGKVPVMMAYYKLAESDSSILDKEIPYVGGTDLNAQQEIVPEKVITPGYSYPVSGLIASMIDYSDNNAANLLTENIDLDALQEAYSDLGVPTLSDPNSSNLDFMTVGDYSRFFRVLYNATYLDADYSEEALKILTGTSFTQGITAGIPASTIVAHKFGLTSISTAGTVTSRELHDCGIVYAPNNPYELCIMTKSLSTIPNIETAISDISSLVYKEVEGGYR